jgi:hypothetical protein
LIESELEGTVADGLEQGRAASWLFLGGSAFKELMCSFEVARIPPLFAVSSHTRAVDEEHIAAGRNSSHKPLDFLTCVLIDYTRIGEVWISCRLIFDVEFIAPGDRVGLPVKPEIRSLP